jgi:hypothetical protein
MHQNSDMPSITQQQCLQRLRSRSAAFRATRGARHFFLLTGDNGPCCVDGRYKDVDFLKYRIIGNHGQDGVAHHHAFFGIAPPIPCFDARKDISIPAPSVHRPRVPHATLAPWAQTTDLSRELLLFAVGKNRHSACRVRLLRMFEGSHDPSVLVRASLPRNETARMMLRARFCPICSGFTPWTQRLPEALAAGCVPILVRERWRLPFEGILDYTRFSGSIPLSRLSSLVTYAKSLDHAHLQRGALIARWSMLYDLGVEGVSGAPPSMGDGMLPLLAFEMWRRLRVPVPSADWARTLRSGVDTSRAYSPAFRASKTKAESADGKFILNASFAYLNATTFRCRTTGKTCECARASGESPVAKWNGKMLKPFHVDVPGDHATERARWDVPKEAARWLHEHYGEVLSPGGHLGPLPRPRSSTGTHRTVERCSSCARVSLISIDLTIIPLERKTH